MAPVGTAFDKISANWKAFSLAFLGGYSIKQGVTQVWNLYDATTKLGDRMYDLSKRTGIGTKALSGLEYAAKQTGTSVESMDTALVRMMANISQAGSGMAEQGAVFKALGLDIKAIKELSGDEAFIAIADAIGRITNQNDQLNATRLIFGRMGDDVLPLIKEGPDAIRKYAQELERMGAAITPEFARAADEAQDAINRLNKSFEGLQINVVSTFADNITDMINAMSRLTTWVECPIPYRTGMRFSAVVVAQQ